MVIRYHILDVTYYPSVVVADILYSHTDMYSLQQMRTNSGHQRRVENWHNPVVSPVAILKNTTRYRVSVHYFLSAFLPLLKSSGDSTESVTINL